MPIVQSRRRFLTNAALAGAAGLGGLGAVGVGGGRTSLAAEPPPETTVVRLTKLPTICIAPQYVAEDADFSLHYAAPTIMAIDAGKPITVLAGVHVGCFELFGSERIHTIGEVPEYSAPSRPW